MSNLTNFYLLRKEDASHPFPNTERFNDNLCFAAQQWNTLTKFGPSPRQQEDSLYTFRVSTVGH